ncbi:hypothetical protein UFOVP733_19 [uncultured Caudovirales phage]|uniref:Uncharacterized protein n=1 Tax=uncultured Caudovirales phage TaxID=2100421 RepID=A0A6J5NM83_9CAUD|nr:hypothetical protein UFOVP733_19 [uncultured Caudovirales phage]CAB5224931.1 hypothetical protein UFOVP743_40 [uncultured Caudovirales phage]
MSYKSFRDRTKFMGKLSQNFNFLNPVYPENYQDDVVQSAEKLVKASKFIELKIKNRNLSQKDYEKYSAIAHNVSQRVSMHCEQLKQKIMD